MKLGSFMNKAYEKNGAAPRRKKGRRDMIFSLEDMADRVGERPDRSSVEKLVGEDQSQIDLLLSSRPDKRCARIWGYVSSLAAEMSTSPLRIAPADYAGLEMRRGTIILEKAESGSKVVAAHVGERMDGGRIVVFGAAGDYLGHEMRGGRIVASGCRDYAFRNMKGGWGVVRGNAGKFTGLGNSGGRILVQGSCSERAGWLMRSGRLEVGDDAGEYLGLLMSGGEIIVNGSAGRRAGWRKKGGSIAAGSFGPEAADDVLELG
jgi:formylmethanofuran dehydrogenase subunit C